MVADLLSLLVGVYFGGVIVAAWIMYMGEEAFDELGTNLLLIFGWPVMMLLTIAFDIYDGMKGTPDA